MRGPVTRSPGHPGALVGLVAASALVCGLLFCATNVSRTVSSGGADWNSDNGGFVGRLCLIVLSRSRPVQTPRRTLLLSSPRTSSSWVRLSTSGRSASGLTLSFRPGPDQVAWVHLPGTGSNLTIVWSALASLPLSTVGACSAGFSRFATLV